MEAEQAEFRCDAGFRVFESRELTVATDNFSPGRVLNEGKLGRVYKGILKDGQEVAVKRFAKQTDLWGEVRMLSCLDHPNLVKLIGYCDEGKDHMIVCEYMPLRSLNLHLHDIKPGKKPLDWKTRMKIAEGVARALEYLHHGMDPLIIYNCLEVSKILLNENYNPKLSDFGCAEIAIPVDHCRVRTKPAVGYVSREYTTTRNITSKSDVYCFGVVLLELISGQKAFDATRNGERDIVAWARPMLRDKQAEFRCDAGVRVFKLRELIVATDKFSPGRVLNEGKVGRVYKGILKDGQVRVVNYLPFASLEQPQSRPNLRTTPKFGHRVSRSGRD
ncbi:probable serine/threonine-protein kinase PBL7 [Papaver somniferum]|uniref:probable serine/threonine-protein kinase PBL7 n=1 Tax=Papaver somniferum TaxID=3469 RepID=UPI000E6F6DB9|nr:probable serine/threonine-protein kinase PBL7 [Papaver somniferum]